MTGQLFKQTLPLVGEVLAIILMGAAFLFILVRGVRMLMGKKESVGIAKASKIPWSTLAIVALIALVSRMLLYFIAWVFISVKQGNPAPFFDAISSLWVKWDARHYLKIATQGYVNTGDDRLALVFFPMYPLLIHLLTYITGNMLLSSLIISNIAAVGATVLLYMLATGCYGKRIGMLSVAYFLLNPYSFFLCAPYPEGLFLLFTFAALYCVSKGKLGWAGMFGALSAFTRMLGLVVCGVIIIHMFRQIVHKRCRDRAQKVVWGLFCAAVVFVGFALYLLINLKVSGAPFTFMVYQKQNWYQSFGSFWGSVKNTVYYLFAFWGSNDTFYTWTVQLVAMFYAFILLLAMQRKVSLEHAAYSFAYLFIALAPTWLLSGPRYIFGMATLPILQAQRFSKSDRPHTVLLILNAALLLFFTYAYTILNEVF